MPHPKPSQRIFRSTQFPRKSAASNVAKPAATAGLLSRRGGCAAITALYQVVVVLQRKQSFLLVIVVSVNVGVDELLIVVVHHAPSLRKSLGVSVCLIRKLLPSLPGHNLLAYASVIELTSRLCRIGTLVP